MRYWPVAYPVAWTWTRRICCLGGSRRLWKPVTFCRMFAEQARSKFRRAVNLNALDSKRHLQMKQAFPSAAHWSHLLLLIAVPEHHLYHSQK